MSWYHHNPHLFQFPSTENRRKFKNQICTINLPTLFFFCKDQHQCVGKHWNVRPTANALARVSSSNRHLFRVPAVSAYKSFHCSWWIHDHENNLTSLIVSNIVLWYYLCGSQIINTTINSLSYKYPKKFFKEVPDAANINDPSSQLFLLAAGLLGSTLSIFKSIMTEK